MKMITVAEHREAFGAELKALRQQRKWTLKEVEERTGINGSYVSATENGDNALGSDVAVKLADVFGLSGDERDAFLVNAAATRKRDRLVAYSRPLSAQILNYVPKTLVASGVVLDEIVNCAFRKASVESGKSTDELVLDLQDGRSVICNLVVTPSP